MLKAGSLLYAIYVCLILAILSSGLLYVFILNKNLSSRYDMQDRLIERCNSCFALYLSDKKQFQNNATQDISLFDDGIRCHFELKRWGMYAKLMGKIYFKNDTIRKNALIGEVINDDQMALYLGDFGEELKISGTTQIIGNVKLPKKGYETVNILGNQKINNPKIQGAVRNSSQELPKLELPGISQQNSEIISVDDLQYNTGNFNSFSNKTLEILVHRGESLDRLAIKGNYVINALDTLYIDANSKIEDVIIKAPKVVVEKGFKGSLQIFAKKEVVIEEEVQLSYPSCIVITNETLLEGGKRITIGKEASVYGGVVIDAKSFKDKQENELIIAEDALITGDLYCNGILELKGMVIGTVYAHKLQLKTDFSLYSDVLLNAKIDATRLPKEFIRLPLFQNSQNNEFGIIKSI